MNILLQCNIPSTSDYRYGLLNTLKRMKGVNVKHIPLSEKIIESWHGFSPKLYIGIKRPLSYIDVNYFHNIDCKTIQLNPDDPDIFDRAKEWVDQYDYFFTNSRKAQIKYAMEKKIVDVCSFAVDEKLVEECKPRDEFKCDIMFAGGDNLKKYRHEYLNALKGLDVKVYGRFQKPVHGLQKRYLSTYQEYFSAIKSAKIAIDFSVSGAGFLNVKTKSFEIPACNTLMMVNKFSEMESYYKYDEEIIGFNSPEELRKKCEHYLKKENEVDRLAIAENGYCKFIRDHTWEKRIKEVFKKCGVDYE
jgi:spore maturation protein CgeB